MAEIIDFHAEKALPYIRTAFIGFMNDPPDTQYQLGYLAALVDLYNEGLGRQDDIYNACYRMVYGEKK